MGKQWKQWEILFSWAPKSLQLVTAAMKFRHLLLGRKAMTNLDSILKSRDITLLTKVCIVKAVVSSSSYEWIWELNHKKAGHRRIDAFALWCWRRLLRVSWTARQSNQSILKEINPEYSSGLIMKPKLQYFGHLMGRADSLEKTLMLGNIEARRRKGNGCMASPTQWTWIWASSGRWWRDTRCAAVHGVTKSWTWLSDWTTIRDCESQSL